MPKTKISEFSATPANNTDIDSINIAEGCAPSGINDAIRELMAQLKDFQTGAVGDSFNGPINGTVGATTPAAGAFTTLSASSTLGVTGVSTLTGGAVVQGLTVGRGAGAVATNTAVGASALAANTTGNQLVAVGANALAANTSGADNVAIGQDSLAQTTTAINNSAIGTRSLWSNTTGSQNTGLGRNALRLNTTGSYNTAQGVDALYSNTTASNNTAVGYQSLYSNTTGAETSAFGWRALVNNTTGNYNQAFGNYTLGSNSTGSNNTGLGYNALYNNTTASNNTAVGYQAGYSNLTGAYNTFVGRVSGYGSTGAQNTFVGESSGTSMTTGSKNTILGSYNGNQGSLDIRTASNYIVLSDGDGNPYAQCNASFWKFGIGGTGSAYGGGSVSLNGSTASGYQPSIGGYGNGTAYWTIGTKGSIDGSSSTFLQCQNTGGGVYLNGASATSWTAVSDERLKENLVDITDAAAKVSTLRAVVGNYTWDEEKSRKPFLIAQDVQAVLPEAVSASRQIKGDETEYLGVSYTEVIPLLVAAIKELKAEFDAYKLTHP